MPTTPITLVLEPRRTARALAAAIVLLIAASFAGQLLRLSLGYSYAFGLIPLTYVDREANLPSWFSSAILLLGAAVLWANASDARGEGDRFAPHWRGLAAVFLLLSVDETAGIHEAVGGVLKRLLPADGVLYYTWVLPGGLFVLVLGAVYLRFLWSLPARTRSWLGIAAACYLGGALGVEMVTGIYESTYATKRSLAFILLTHTEELMEMVGVAVLVYALLDYRVSRAARVSVPVSAAAAPSAASSAA